MIKKFIIEPVLQSIVKIKLLPILIVFVALFMSFRVQSFVSYIMEDTSKYNLFEISTISAKNKENEEDKKDKNIDNKLNKEEDETFDPLKMDEYEVKILLKLAEQREDILKKNKSFNKKEVYLNAIYKKIKNKIESLSKIKNQINDLLKKFNKLDSLNTKRLIELYSNMKPNDAARIMNDLPIDVLLPVIQKIDAAKASAIMSVMDKKRVREVTAHMVALQSIMPEGKKK